MGEGPDVVLAPRPRRRQELVLRHRGRPLAPLPRPRARPAGLRLVVQARDRALQRALVRPDGARDDGRAGHRARPRRRQLDGRPRRRSSSACAQPERVRRSACCVRPWPSSSAPITRLVRLLRPELGAAAPPLHPRTWSRTGSGPVRRPATWSTRRRRHRRSTSSSASTRSPARGSPSSPRRATSTSTSPFGRAASTRASPSSRRRRCSCGARTTSSIPAGFERHVSEWLPQRRADRARQLRPRAAGRAPRADQRAAAALLRAGRRARRPRRAAGLPQPRRRSRHSALAADAEPAPASRARLAATEHDARGPSRAAPSSTRLRARSRRPGLPAASRPPTSTSATPTTSASSSRACGCSPASGSAARCAGLGNIPEDGAGAARRQPLGRQPHAGHDVFTLAFSAYFGVERRFYQLGPQPRAVDAGARLPAQVRHRRRLARERARRRSTPARRCSSTRAATTRSTARSGSATRSTSTAARASCASRSSRTCRSSPSSSIGGQETALFLVARRAAWRKLLRLDKLLRAQGAADLARDPVGPERRRHARPLPAAGEDRRRGAAADPPARGVRRRPRRRRGLRPRHRGSCRRPSTRSPPSAACRSIG